MTFSELEFFATSEVTALICLFLGCFETQSRGINLRTSSTGGEQRDNE